MLTVWSFCFEGSTHKAEECNVMLCFHKNKLKIIPADLHYTIVLQHPHCWIMVVCCFLSPGIAESSFEDF